MALSKVSVETREQYRTRLASQLRALRADGWRSVGKQEIQKLWTSLQGEGKGFNGCTHWALRRIYGESMMHLAGWGWLKRKKVGTQNGAK